MQHNTPMTNVELVTEMMEYSRFGALAQLFIMEAITRYADSVSKAHPEALKSMENGLISPQAWQGVAIEIAHKLSSRTSGRAKEAH